MGILPQSLIFYLSSFRLSGNTQVFCGPYWTHSTCDGVGTEAPSRTFAKVGLAMAAAAVFLSSSFSSRRCFAAYQGFFPFCLQNRRKDIDLKVVLALLKSL